MKLLLHIRKINTKEIKKFFKILFVILIKQKTKRNSHQHLLGQESWELHLTGQTDT